MITITSAVENILHEDGFALEAMQRGLLNLSAYAKEIHPLVEKATFKPVNIGSIVVAMTRINQDIMISPAFTPKIEFTSLSVTSSLLEITYEKTTENSKKLSTLNTSLFATGEFFTITEGLHEITIICSNTCRAIVLQHFTSKPKIVIEDLVAISVRFSDQYIDVPNTIYSLVGILATQHINLMEIVSTYTELTFVVFRSEMEKTVSALDRYSQKKSIKSENI